ncbi:MAG: YvrJ family protein [Negativicutes bacterium]|nr:YvrJ family protein [Negativicutes bacterium]
MDSATTAAMQTVADTVAGVGFPIAVCWYLLSRLERKFDVFNERIAAMTEALNGLRAVIAVRTEELGK